jgi:hypothetical protein
MEISGDCFAACGDSYHFTPSGDALCVCKLRAAHEQTILRLTRENQTLRERLSQVLTDKAFYDLMNYKEEQQQ